MKFLKNTLSFFLFVFLTVHLSAQTEIQKKQIIESTNVDVLLDYSKRQSLIAKQEKQSALELAKIKGWEEFIYKQGAISELIGLTAEQKPIYYTTFNRGSGQTIRANDLYTGGSLGLNIHGQGIKAGIWDIGAISHTHELFEGRVNNMDPPNMITPNGHANNVGGTIIGGDGFEGGLARGIAFEGELDSYNWGNDMAEISAAVANGLLVSNHSYGPDPDFVDDDDYGWYSGKARDVDFIMHNAPYYQFVCATGNASGIGVNEVDEGYNLLLGIPLAKNGIAVAAVKQVDEYTGPWDVILADFSSWGGGQDGRIKPDISAKGYLTYSAESVLDNGSSTYGSRSGTSMAAPAVTGALMLLQQYYEEQKTSFMKSSSLRALMINTAQEAGPTPGPDYKFGWGLMNTAAAAKLIEQTPQTAHIIEEVLLNNQTYEMSILANEEQRLVLTLAWTDPEGSIIPFTNSLINDLDIRVYTEQGEVFYPWRLDANNPAAAAMKADNIVDNIEQITIEDPLSGEYRIVVSHKGSLQNGEQAFSLVVSGIEERHFFIKTAEENVFVCQGITDSTSINLEYIESLSAPTNLEVDAIISQIPQGITAVLSQDEFSENSSFTLQLNGLSTLTEGIHELELMFSSQTEQVYQSIYINVYQQEAEAVLLNEPLDGDATVPLNPWLSFFDAQNAQAYYIEIAADENFENIVFTKNTIETTVFCETTLDYNTNYYWRVYALNECGISAASQSYSFKTACDSVAPQSIEVLHIGGNNISVQWLGVTGIDAWQVEAVVQGQMPTGQGDIVDGSDDSYVIGNLDPLVTYDIYVRVACEDTFSNWSEPTTVQTKEEYCEGAHFYDTGGSMDTYNVGENYSKTIYPEYIGDRVVARFDHYRTQNYHFLNVYNGPDTTYPLLMELSGDLSFEDIGLIQSTEPNTGALTFMFNSEQTGGVQRGWDVRFFCESFPLCEEVDIVDFRHVKATKNEIEVSWVDVSPALEWELMLVVQGQAFASGNLFVTSSAHYLFEGLSENTNYDLFIRSICEEGRSAWSSPFKLATQADYCGGVLFYDSGGDDANYSYNEHYIKRITPEVEGERVRLVFEGFFIGTGDTLKIYNGMNTDDPLIQELQGVHFNSNEIQATNPNSGALTLEFTSDDVFNGYGWEAGVVCEPFPDCPNTVANVEFSNVYHDRFTISWDDLADFNSWELKLLRYGDTLTTVVVHDMQEYTFEGLEEETSYRCFVRPICDENTNADLLEYYSISTTPDYCGGSHYYDPAGVAGYYAVGSYTKTIRPNDSQDLLRAQVNLMALGANDTLWVHNGESRADPVLIFFTTADNGGDLFYSTHASGALTFHLQALGTGLGWDIEFVCVAQQDCPITVQDAALYEEANRHLGFIWQESDETITNWDVALVENGQDIDTFYSVDTTYFRFNDLTPYTLYDLYIRSVCEQGVSVWYGPFTYRTMRDLCSNDEFYISDGSFYYAHNLHQIKSIIPPQDGYYVRAIIQHFNTLPGDTLWVYDGPDIHAPLIAALSGDLNLAPIVANNMESGALCFEFKTDSSQNTTGWVIRAECQEFQDCGYTMSDLHVLTADPTSIAYEWDDDASISQWEVLFMSQGGDTLLNEIVTQNYISFTNLEEQSPYVFYVRSICENGVAPWADPIYFATPPDFCGGIHFYDEGGPDEDYDIVDTTLVIVPAQQGGHIVAIVNELHIGDGFTRLSVYDGPDVNYPLLATLSGQYNPYTLDPFVSTEEQTGALTFEFVTNTSGPPGWDISIYCAGPNTCAYNQIELEMVNNGLDWAAVSWPNVPALSEWEIEVVPHLEAPSGIGQVISQRPYVIHDLEQGMRYDVYLKGLCDQGDTPWSEPITVQPLCEFIQAPIYESFEVELMPLCWYGEGYLDWNFTSNATGTATGVSDYTLGQNTNYAWVNTNLDDGVLGYSYLYTGPVNIANLTQPTLQFAFFAKRENHLYNQFDVDVFNGNTWVNIYSDYAQSQNEEWELVTLDVSNLNLEDIIEFRFGLKKNMNANSNVVLLDDIILDDWFVLDNEQPFITNRELEYFPNPVDEILRINALDEIYAIRFYDLTTNLLLNKRVGNKKRFEIDVSSLNQGLYWVEVEGRNGELYIFKLVKL